MIIENKCEEVTPHYVTWKEEDIEGKLEKYFVTKEEAMTFYECNGRDMSKSYELYLDNKKVVFPSFNPNECEMIIDTGKVIYEEIDGVVTTSKLSL